MTSETKPCYYTGWDRHWRTEGHSNGNHPFLIEAAAT